MRQQLPSLPQFYIQLFPHVKKPVKMKAILNHHSRKKKVMLFLITLKKKKNTRDAKFFYKNIIIIQGIMSFYDSNDVLTFIFCSKIDL